MFVSHSSCKGSDGSLCFDEGSLGLVVGGLCVSVGSRVGVEFEAGGEGVYL